MKIAYIVPSLAAKGPVIVAKDISDLMISHGHSCVVYYFDDIIELQFKAQTHKLAKDEIIDFKAFDIIHSHGLRPDKYIAKHREYSGKVRYISTVHNYILEDLKYQYNWFIAQVFGRLWIRYLQKFDCVVTLSKHALDYYQRWLDKSKLSYAYNSIIININAELTTEETLTIINFKGYSCLIGVNALLTPRKGVDLIIKALPELPNHKLFIAGDGKSRQELEELAKKMGVYERCYFAGFCTDAYRYLPFYDIYAMPSRSEGFGLSLLEAAQYKTSTVCSDIPIFKELFSDNEVEFFDLSNTSSLVTAINKATTNKGLGENMYKRYKKCYTPENMYERYFLIYNGKI